MHTLLEKAADQRVVQADKLTYRTLAEYDDLLFGNQYVSAFLAAQTGARSLEGMLGNAACQSENTFNWVDMCGGYAVAMRQVAEACKLGNLSMTSVDLVEWSIEELEGDKDFREGTLGYELEKPEHAPNSIIDDAETVILPEPANLVTSIMGIQYLDDPLRAIANWYNQLKPGGIAVITSGSYYWSLSISQNGGGFFQPVKSLIESMTEAGVAFEVAYDESYGPEGRYRLQPVGMVSCVAIKRKQGTSLAVNSKVVEVTTDAYGYGYKDVVYSSSDRPIEVVDIGEYPAGLHAGS